MLFHFVSHLGQLDAMQGRTAREVDRKRCCWTGNVRQPWLRMLAVLEDGPPSLAAELCVAAVEAAVVSLVVVVFVVLVVVVAVVGVVTVAV